MWVVVTYDVNTESAAGRTRLRRVALECQNFGQRVQKSVFECSVNEAEYEQMRRRLLGCIDRKEDSLRLYRMSEPRERNVEEFGIGHVVDFSEDALVV